MHIIGQVLRLSQSQLNPISSLTLANPLLSMIPNRFCVEFSLPGSSVHPTQITSILSFLLVLSPIES